MNLVGIPVHKRDLLPGRNHGSANHMDYAIPVLPGGEINYVHTNPKKFDFSVCVCVCVCVVGGGVNLSR